MKRKLSRALKITCAFTRSGEYPHIKLAEALNLAIAALRAQEQNEPLTLEQVKARKWVWIDNDTARRNQGWAKVFAMYDLANLEAVSYSFANYGKTWLAYAHEPKGAHQ